MANQDHDPPAHLGLGYASLQLAKAFFTADNHPDGDARKRARQKVSSWEQILNNMVSGQLAYGDRQPVAGAPAWVTLEVVTGGFATGAFLAGGELVPYEKEYLGLLPFTPAKGDERLAINCWLLSEEGLSHLDSLLKSGATR